MKPLPSFLAEMPESPTATRGRHLQLGFFYSTKKIHGGSPCLQQISALTKKTVCWVVTRSSEWMVRDLLSKNKKQKG
jgi:hypothetical protein